MQKKKRTRGRPALPPSEGKRNQLVFRVTNEMRARLDASAKASGRSLSHEAEMRLERSFWEEDKIHESFGGPDEYRLMKWLALSLQVAEGITKKTDSETFLSSVAAMTELAKLGVPSGAMEEDLRKTIIKQIVETLGKSPEPARKRQAKKKREEVKE